MTLYTQYVVKTVPIGPQDPVAIEGPYPLLGDHSRSGIPAVEARFIGTQARLATSIRYVEIARNIAPQLFAKSSSNSAALNAGAPRARRFANEGSSLFLLGFFAYLVSLAARAFISSWRVLPERPRKVAYGGLRMLGAWMYGTSDPIQVQRLPFGLYLKVQGDPDMVRNEFNALRRFRRETSIPVPKPIDMISADEGSYLLITCLPGFPLWRCQELFSDTDCDEIVTQLKDYVAQLRALPKTVNREMAICNTLGEACQDPRIQSADPIGPFKDEAAFSQCLRFSDEPGRRGHEIVFSHADLNPRNILVDQVPLSGGGKGWRVTGIVDWETAGYYPEYWDYTKALFEGFRWKPRYLKMVHRVFEEFGDYSRELDVERRAWESGDGV